MEDGGSEVFHESAHVMQACNGGLIWEEYHPRMLRTLKNKAPHYYEILQQYRGGDFMIELEAFDVGTDNFRSKTAILIYA